MATSLDELERLGDLLAQPAPSKRMLIIVNPYATTVSDRLKNLVVYALRGRYQVDAVETQSRDHATALSREAAHEGYDIVVAFGGDGTVNEAAQRPGRLADAAGRASPAAPTNVYCRVLGVPNEIVDATEHLLRLADDWRPRPVDLGAWSTTVTSRSRPVLGLDASVVERVDAHPYRKAKFGEAGTSPGRRLTSSTATICSDPAPQTLDVRWAARSVRGVTRLSSRTRTRTRTSTSARSRSAQGAELDSGTLAGAVLATRQPVDMPTIPGARCPSARDRQATAGSRLRRR